MASPPLVRGLCCLGLWQSGLLSATSPVPVAFESVPFDQGRWVAWVTKGRLADAAFTERVRMLAMLGVTVGIAAGTV